MRNFNAIQDKKLNASVVVDWKSGNVGLGPVSPEYIVAQGAVLRDPNLVLMIKLA